MKTRIIASMLLIIALNLQAQNIKLGFETGIGTYQMTVLKSYMIDAVEKNVLKPHIVTNFPAYLYFQPSISYSKDMHTWGFNITFVSTGARASIRDYSGEYRYDNKVVGYAPALFEEVTLFQKQKLSILLRADVGVIYTDFQFNEYFQVNESVYINESEELMSLNLFAKPGLKAIYKLTEEISIEANIGYHFDLFRGTLAEPTDPINYLKFGRQKGVEIQWDGIRAGLGCTINI